MIFSFLCDFSNTHELPLTHPAEITSRVDVSVIIYWNKLNLKQFM